MGVEGNVVLGVAWFSMHSGFQHGVTSGHMYIEEC